MLFILIRFNLIYPMKKIIKSLKIKSHFKDQEATNQIIKIVKLVKLVILSILTYLKNKNKTVRKKKTSKNKRKIK